MKKYNICFYFSDGKSIEIEKEFVDNEYVDSDSDNECICEWMEGFVNPIDNDSLEIVYRCGGLPPIVVNRDAIIAIVPREKLTEKDVCL